MKAGALCACALMVLVGQTVEAAPGDLDPDFQSPSGYTLYTHAFWGKAVAVQPDGKSVATGVAWNGTDWDVVVVRFLIDGSVDPGFGIEGARRLDCAGGEDQVEDLAVQPDGRILVAGSCWGTNAFDAWVVRLTPDGALDGSFGAGGSVRYDGPAHKGDGANAVRLQPDGKVLVVGSSYSGTDHDVLVLRLLPSGSLDPGFGNGGVVLYNGGSGGDFGADLALQADGKILVTGSTVVSGGYSLLVLRLQSDGRLDGGFGTAGAVVQNLSPVASDYGNALALQADGKILVAGTTWGGPGNPDLLLLRLDPSGALDPLFGTGGAAVHRGPYGKGDFGLDLAIQQDGRILVVGETQTFVGSILDADLLVLRYLPDGSLDPDFGSGGVVTFNGTAHGSDRAHALALQTDGKILVVGQSGNTQTGYASSDLLLLRLMGRDHTPDARVNGKDGPVVTPSSGPVSLTVRSVGPASPGPTVDWWVVVLAPWGGYFLEGSVGWRFDPLLANLAPAAQLPLSGFGPLTVASLPGLPPGHYSLYFGYDQNPNSVLDFDSLVYDRTDLHVY